MFLGKMSVESFERGAIFCGEEKSCLYGWSLEALLLLLPLINLSAASDSLLVFEMLLRRLAAEEAVFGKN